MIIFLYGKDGYRLKQNLDKIIEEYQKKHTDGMSFLTLDADDGPPSATLEKLEDLVKTVSFFGEKRLIVIRNPFLISRELASLLKKWRLDEDKERIVACVEAQSEGELNKKDKTFYALLTAKPNVIKNSEPLAGKHLESWVVKETASYDKKIDMPAIKNLISLTSGDSWLLSREINKLANYKNSAGSDTITAADINLLVTPKEDVNIFEVVDAVANRNRLWATKLIYNHLESGMDPYYIFSMIVYQFRNLLRVKGLAQNAVPYSNIIKKAGLNPYVVKKTYDQCKKYDINELKNMFNKLADIDLESKNGEMEMTEALYRFVFNLQTKQLNS